MSLAVAQGTSLFIIQRKAQIEFRLMQITNHLAKLAYQVADDSTNLLATFQSQIASNEGIDEAAVAEDVMTNTEFSALYQNITAQYHAHEKILTNEKKQLETEEKALTTQEEGINKMIEAGIKQGFTYGGS